MKTNTRTWFRFNKSHCCAHFRLVYLILAEFSRYKRRFTYERKGVSARVVGPLKAMLAVEQNTPAIPGANCAEYYQPHLPSLLGSLGAQFRQDAFLLVGAQSQVRAWSIRFRLIQKSRFLYAVHIGMHRSSKLILRLVSYRSLFLSNR